MLTMEFVAGVHAVAAALVLLGTYAYVVFTYNTPETFADVRENVGRIAWPQFCMQFILSTVLAALVGSAWYGFLTLVAALI